MKINRTRAWTRRSPVVNLTVECLDNITLHHFRGSHVTFDEGKMIRIGIVLLFLVCFGCDQPKPDHLPPIHPAQATQDQKETPINIELLTAPSNIGFLDPKDEEIFIFTDEKPKE